MSSSAASRRRKNNQIMYRYRDHCKFMQCATQLDNGDSSADYVRVMRCVREQDTNAPSKPDEASKEHSSSITKFRKNEIVELQQPPHAATATAYKSDARTMIITTTSFTSIPMKPSHTQNAIYVKPLIVLDLNGILCHRIRESKQSAMTNTRYKTSLGRIANTEVIPRSDLAMFLQLLNSHFTLAVWTSATSKTAKGLVKMLFPEEIRKRLLFVWHRSFCNLIKNGDDGRKSNKRRKMSKKDVEEAAEDEHVAEDEHAESVKPFLPGHHQDLVAIKSLSKVWSTYPLWDQNNTLLLDDSPDKCPRKYRGNAIHPLPLCGTETRVSDKSTMTSLTVDDDEENENLQRQFFRLLVHHWSSPQTRIVDESVDGTVSNPASSLNQFLNSHAKSFNIQWKDNS